MKKQRFFMLGIITVLVAVLSLTFVSSTFAKYTSTVNGSDSARVAKWDFQFNSTDFDLDSVEDAAEEITFNLFNTLTSESNVSKTDGTIIAPGTSGSFTFKISNLSEVTAQYALDYSAVNTANIPVEYSLDESTWSKDINSLDVTASDATKLAYLTGESANITVYWRWAFYVNEAGDQADTTLGIEGTDTIEVTLKVILTQVD